MPAALFALANHDLNDLGLQKCGDRGVLIALYNATDGANWTDKTNWNSDKPIGEWYGVTTDDDGRVHRVGPHQQQFERDAPRPTWAGLAP